MTRLRLVDARQMEKILFVLEFAKVRQKGSHAFYRHADGRTTTLPHHSSRMLARPLIRAILREIDLPVDEYERLLQQR